MLLDKMVAIKWNSANKRHYTERGYVFTKCGDEFKVHIIDASKGCNSYVRVQCDYCGRVVEKPLYNYFKDIEKTIRKDACKDCSSVKAKEAIEKKYGVRCTQELPHVKNKTTSTMLERYGHKYYMQSKHAYNTIKKIEFSQYGKWFVQTDEFKKKTNKTNLERYGCEWYLGSDEAVKSRTGENHPRWKGGFEYHGDQRKTPEYIEWRSSVFKRDGYTCKCCGRKPRIVHAHHIYNYATYKDLRLDIHNGITLCPECHREYHKIYGYENTNIHQLEEFLLTHGKNIV